MKKHLSFVLCLIFGLIISLVAITSYIPFAEAIEICVDINGNAPPDLTCYESIQSAIDNANSGDEIIVYSGTYKECINFLGKAITVRSKDPNDSSVVNQTIIDGSQGNSVVTFNHGEMSNSILNGFTIRNGKAIRGGGVSCESSSPNIIKCTIRDNRNVTNGGGICCYNNSSPIIESCSLINNNASFYGGGIFCDANSSPSIISCKITNNSTSSGGGIACFTNSSPIIERCFIQNNLCSSNGGAIYCSNASPSIKGSFISGNKCSEHGGAIYCSNASPSIKGSFISSNNSSSNGGGIYCTSSSPYCENTIISSNAAKYSAGGIYSLNSTISLTNCTVSRNSASTSGGIFCPDGSSISIKNCIIWDNSPDEMSGCNPVISYSDIKTEERTVFPGTGNINKDPLFLYPEKENYYLQPNSPCIDIGTNDGSPENDIANKTRPQDGDGDGIPICEMGAYEFFLPQVHYVDPNGSIQEKINEAYHFDVIIVPNGIYRENINFLDKALMLTSENPDNQEIVNATVIDGGRSGNVVTFNQEHGKYSSLQGFSVQNGSGQGIYCYNSSSPNILNCNIHTNNSYGIYCYNSSSPNILNCNIHTNNSHGIYCYNNSSPNILNCNIHTNNSYGICCNHNCSPKILICNIDNNRRGIYCYSGSSPSIQDSIISNNSESGISCFYSSPHIMNCNISWNSATNGGGIYCFRSSPNIINSTIIGNTTSNAGGGIFCDNNSLPSIENCIITWNLAITGGGIYCYNNSSPDIIHCTINENVANTWGGISCSNNSAPNVKNSILWNNSPLSEQIYIDVNSPAVTYSDIQVPEGLYPGTGNINEDPLFINPGKWDLRLHYNSPCIDRGDPNYSLTEDIEGIQRPHDGNYDGNSICDMGAYEFWQKLCFMDSDEDGYGDPYETEEVIDYDCPYGYVENNLDCNDMDPNINPDVIEIPGNDIDENCDGFIHVEIDSNEIGKEIQVDPNYGHETIQSAIDAAKPGNVIIVSPGTYKENITISGKAVTLQSIDPNDPNVVKATIIDGGETGSVVSFKYDEIYYDSNDLAMEIKNVLSGFTIRNGKANYGGGIYCEFSSPSIENCIIIDNSSFPYGGGGIYCDNSSASIKNCALRKNSASYGGGVCLKNSSSVIEYCTIEENSGFIKGGGIFCNTSSVNIKSCLITKNSAHFGAGIYSEDSSLIFTDSSTSWNTANGLGGGIYFLSSPSGPNNLTSNLTNCIIERNSASIGGGVYCSNSSLSFEECTIQNNSGSNNGGGIYCKDCSPDFLHCKFASNYANSNGGGIYCTSSSPNFEYCSFASNSCRSKGGGIYCYNSSPIVNDCTFNSNQAYSAGGAIYSDQSSPNFTGCAFRYNKARYSQNPAGGAIHCTNNSTPIVKNCTISSNEANYAGGGIYCANSSFPELLNCIISSNLASIGDGGGIYCSSSSMSLINCTVSNNSAPASGGGGIFCSGSSMDLTNCIVSRNSASTSGGGIFGSEDGSIFLKNCIVWGNSPEAISDHCDPVVSYSDIQVEEGTVFPGIGNINEDPLFLYSEKEIYYLHPNSPCIDTGTNEEAPATDMANETRPQDGNEDGVSICDMGIYEFFPPLEHHVNSNENIQNSIDGTHHFDVIIIHPGTYYENINFHGKAITLTSEDPNNQDIVNSTFIDGNNTGDVVTFSNNEGKLSVLKGLRLKNGSGHGIYCYNSSSPSILNCNINDNKSYGIFCDYYCSPNIQNCNIMINRNYGIYCWDNSSPNILNCDIIDNNSYGIYCNWSCSPSIIGCNIKNNHSNGIYCNNNSSPIIQDCDIMNNYNIGIYCYNNSSPSISNCIIKNNSSQGIHCNRHCSPNILNCNIIDNNSYGIYCYYSSPNIQTCKVKSNNSHGIYCYYNSSPTINRCIITDHPNGSGIYCNNSSSPIITNSFIALNSTSNGGGINCANSSSPHIIHCTIAYNIAHSGSGIYCDSSSPVVKDSIIWWNFPRDQQIFGNSCNVSVTFSDIQMPEGEVYPGEGNINEAPLLTELTEECCNDPNSSCMCPAADSPCIDAGDPNCPVVEDICGKERPQDGDSDGIKISDIGHCEFLLPCCYKDNDGDGYGDPNVTANYIDGNCTSGYIPNAGDCDDIDPYINPVAFEIPCNNEDENCDGFVDTINPPFCNNSFLTCIVLNVGNEKFSVSFGINEKIKRAISSESPKIAFMDPNSGEYYDYFLKECNQEPYHWILYVDANEYYDPESLPILSWESYKLPVKAGYEWKLVQGEMADGNILVSNMAQSDGCSIKPDEGGLFSIVRRPGCTNPITYYRDADKDGYGIDDDMKCLCSPDTDNFYTAIRGGDCSDNDDVIKPGSEEICDEIDNNCDDIIDPPGSKGCASYYKDADRDGYGIDDDTKCLCSPDANSFYTATQGGDCDDNDPLINPGALETACNGVDDNCDGYVDMIHPPLCNDSFLTCIVLNVGDEEFSISFGIDEEIKNEVSPEQAKIAFKGPNPSTFFDYFTKSCGQESYNWILYLNPNGLLASGSYPILSWDTNVLPEREGYEWRLIQGENEINMSQSNSWTIMPDDGEFYSILWLPHDCRPYYRDEDKDGYGLCEDNLYLCTPDPDGIYTALECEDCDDTDPYIYPRKISIADIEARPGETYVEVPVEINDAAGLAGGDFVLTYDPNVLIAQEIKVTPLLQGFLVDYSINQSAGEIYLGMAGSEGIDSGEGTMMKIVFDVSENAGEGVIVPLIFKELGFFNENVEDLCGVPINGKLEIVICTKGDVNQDGEATSADAILVLRIAVKKLIPDPYQECAGDVNGDGEINSADAILILRAAVKKETIFLLRPDHGMPDTTVKIIGWNFGDEQGGASIYFGDVPADPVSWMNREILTTVPSGVPAGYLDVTVVNDKGISSSPCKFMVNQANARLKALTHLYNEDEGPKTISIPNGVIAAPCEQITIPVNIDDAADIAGMDFVFTFDPAILRPVITECTDLTDGFSFDFAASENGRFRISGARSTGIFSGTGSIIDLIFEVSSDARESRSTKITIDNIRLFDENAYPVRATAPQGSEILINVEDFCEEPSAPKTTYQDRYNKHWQFSTPYGYYPSYSYSSLQPFAWTTLWDPSYEMNYFHPNNVFPQALYPVYPSWTENYYTMYTSPWSPQMLYPDISWDLIW